jgi:formylmethanofuran dehydrogenase subunit B
MTRVGSMTSYKMLKMNGEPLFERRKVVCRRCGHIMDDIEPHTGFGEFLHSKRICSNSGKRFSLSPKDQHEVSVFERKRIRRDARRAGAVL